MKRSIAIFLIISLLALLVPYVLFAAAETLYPTGQVTWTNLDGDYTDIDDDPDSPDGNWADPLDDGADTIANVSFDTPTGSLTTGADLQTFKIQIKKVGGSNPVTCRIDLYEGGVLRTSGSATAVTSTVSETKTFTWDASALADPSGADVECYIIGISDATPPAQQATVAIGACKWVVAYDVNTIPTIDTLTPVNIEEVTANLTANITATGGVNPSTRGFQWGTATGTYTDNWTEGGSFGTGVYYYNAENLTAGELYFYRGIAENAVGWGFGDEETFLTKPYEPTSLNVTDIGSTWLYLEWVSGNGSDNTTVRYRTDQYPTGTSDGTLAYSGNATAANVTSLSPGQIYYFRSWSYATEGGLEQYSDLTSDDTDYTLPADPANLATSGETVNSIDLDWTKGTGGDYTTIRYQTGSYPADVYTGSLAYNGTDNSTTVGSLSANTTYYFRGWALDTDSGYYSLGYTQATGNTTATPPVVTPATPTGLVLTIIGDIEINATWNVAANATSYLLLVSIDDYPTDPTGGDAIAYSGNLTSVNLTGYNTDIQVYYFSLWSYANPYSTGYDTAEIGGEALEGFTFLFLPLVLTLGFYFSRQPPLGFASAGAWFIYGVYALSQSTATWDIYYSLFWFSSILMTIACFLHALNLRKQANAGAAEQTDKDLQEVDDSLWGKGKNALYYTVDGNFTEKRKRRRAIVKNAVQKGTEEGLRGRF